MAEKIPVSEPEQKPATASVANRKDVTHADLIAQGVRKRMPMSTAQRKLEVPSIDGYYLYWFKETNVPRALEAGYEFVKRTETSMVNLALGDDRSLNGSTDLGTNVSLIGSLQGTNDGPERAYLMKLRQEWRDEDKAALEEKNATILSAIFRDEKIYGPSGNVREKSPLEYGKSTNNLPLFNRPTRKVKIVR